MLNNIAVCKCFTALWLAVSWVVLTSFSAVAQDAPVLLTIEVSDQDASTERAIEYTRGDLMELPQTSFRTATNWTSGTPVFSGVALSDLLDVLEVTGGTLEMQAINDYSVVFDADDPTNAGAIVALLQDGVPMTSRDKGPLWLVFNYDSDPALRTETVYSRSIWQLDRIIISR